MATDQAIKEEVRRRYGKAAQRAQEKVADSGCCGGESDGLAGMRQSRGDRRPHRG